MISLNCENKLLFFFFFQSKTDTNYESRDKRRRQTEEQEKTKGSDRQTDKQTNKLGKQARRVKSFDVYGRDQSNSWRKELQQEKGEKRRDQ